MKFYSLQLREFIEVPDSDVQIIIMKNGKQAAQAVIIRNGRTLKLFKILGKTATRV